MTIFRSSTRFPQIGHQFEGWADKYGGDYELRLLGRRCIVVTGVAEIRRILSLRPSKFKRGLTEVCRSLVVVMLGFGGGACFYCSSRTEESLYPRT